MGYLWLKNILKNEYGATKFYCKVNYKSYKMIVHLYFSLSEKGVKNFKKRLIYLENKIYISNNNVSFSYTINKFNRVHLECTLYY